MVQLYVLAMCRDGYILPRLWRVYVWSAEDEEIRFKRRKGMGRGGMERR